MKKIATITFHWATNYGAVLQSYALQKVIGLLGYDTEIINYMPTRINVLQKILKLYNRDFSFFKKEKQIKKFRNNELVISKKRYGNNKSLFKLDKKYAAIVSGSDQVWNPSFTLTAEGKPTLSYYLNFANKAKRLSYAASFGTTTLSEDMKKVILPELNKFSAISVREKTARDMLALENINSAVVLDPTLLLESSDYEVLCQKANITESNKVFCYALANGECEIENIYKFVQNELDDTTISLSAYGIYDWLKYIQSSQFVVTNSFHGTVFAILFHKPFVSVKIKGSGMNDRLTTLLNDIGLSERFCESVEETTNIINKQIDWEDVDAKLAILRQNSIDFLSGALVNEG